MITPCSFGSITIAGHTYDRDLIIFPDRVLANWWRKEGQLFQLEDLRDALAYQPEVLVVGTGAHGAMKIAPEVPSHLQQAGIELIAQATPTACQTFNGPVGQRRVAAALHLTC